MYLLGTHDLTFIHIFAGWPGRSADGSVLKHSPLSQTLPQLMNNNSEYLTDTYHILGEKTFPLTKHMVTLYKVQSTKKIPKNIHIAIISSKNI